MQLQCEFFIYTSINGIFVKKYIKRNGVVKDHDSHDPRVQYLCVPLVYQSGSME
jgi:hypothetical protein